MCFRKEVSLGTVRKNTQKGKSLYSTSTQGASLEKLLDALTTVPHVGTDIGAAGSDLLALTGLAK